MIPLVALVAQAPELRRTMAAGPKEAVLMAPPQAVCAAEARRMEWTADGNFLLVVREAADVGEELLAWSRRSGKARSLASYDPRTTKLNDLRPMGGSDRFVLDLTENVREGQATFKVERISLVSASTGTAMPLSLQRLEGSAPLIDAYVSPRRPVGILERIDDRDKRLRAFGIDGKPGPEIVAARTDGFDFDAEGNPRQIRRAPDPKTGESVTRARRIDLATGASGEWGPWKPEPDTEATWPLAVRTEVGSLGGVRASGVLLVLKDGGKDESGVVSTDGTRPLLSPKGDAVAYLDQGLAMVRTLTKIDRAAYDEALRLQRITETVRRAKQLGTGLLQYMADHDDAYPPQGADVRALIGGYVKDDAAFEGFAYTFGGGKAEDVESPADTELGSVAGPGGRAVVYADSHVKWIPAGK